MAKEIELEDAVENGSLNSLKVASKTADITGDGTTTATVLAQEIVSGLKMLLEQSNGFKGIDKAVKAVVNEQKQSIEVGDNLNKIEQVASISANNDNTIGSLIVEAMVKMLLQLKKQKVLTTVEVVEECNSTEDTYRHILSQMLKK